MICPFCLKQFNPGPPFNCRTWTYSTVSFYHHCYFSSENDYSVCYQDIEIQTQNGFCFFMVRDPENALADPILNLQVKKIDFCNILEFIDKYNKLAPFL